MSLKIGNVLKAIDEGKWVKVPAKAGIFHLKIKQLLPAEQYKYRRKFKNEKDLDNVNELKKMVIPQIMEFKGLAAADGQDIAFDQELLKNENFVHAILSLSTEPDGDSILIWLANTMGKSDTFAEDDDPDFLASI